MDGALTRATAYVGLGSNLGDRVAALRGAIAAMISHPQIRVDVKAGVASLYETGPVGVSNDQPDYLNSAVRLETTLLPLDLLTEVLSIEAALGRLRREPGEARVIDIDLLLYEDVAIADGFLTLPHPRLHQRRFVLEPLSEIAGNVMHPVLETSIIDLTRRLRIVQTTDTVVPYMGCGWYDTPPDREVASTLVS